MSWLIFALIGHLANGTAFVIDKALLSTAFKRSATYAGLVGILSLITIVAIPWVNVWPTGAILLVAIISGTSFIFALQTFFAALAKSEASRVVPIVGSLIPILTLAGTATFLNERLTAGKFVGFVLLITATALLSSSGGRARPTKNTVVLAVISASLFAVSSVTGKATYDAVGFLSGFISTRLAAGVTAILIITLLDPFAGRELLSMIRTKKRLSKNTPRHAAGLAIIGQSFGAVGFLFVQLGIARGSAAIVNALQAVQYAFLTLVAFLLRKRAPHLLKESFDKHAIVCKTIAFFITGLGLALII